MSPKVRWMVAIGLVVFGIAGGVLGSFYWACQYVPPFYANALSLEPTVAQVSSDAMLRQTAALASDIRRRRPWQALFTADQINGWLAYDVPKNHPTLIPSEIEQPRVQIDEDCLKVGFRWKGSAWDTVVSLEANIFLQEQNVVAVRIQHARAGKVPLPLAGLVERFVAAGTRIGLVVEQSQIDADPVLLISLPPADEDDHQLLLDSLVLRTGELYLAGRLDGDEDERTLAARSLARAKQRRQSAGESENVQR